MLDKYINQIKKETKNYVDNRYIPYLPISGYLAYLENGERLSFETHYFARRKQLAVLALGYILEKNDRTKNQLEQVIWEICNEYSWSLPAHLPIDKQIFRNESNIWIDLFAAETSQTLAEILELIGEDLHPLVQNRIREEIEKRIFQPFLDRHWKWEDYENNWSSVIGGCIGMSAMSILPENSKSQRLIIDKVDISMQAYLRSFGDDGACEEGLGYWAYGFGYYLYFAQKLSEKLKIHKYLEIPKVRAIASFPYFISVSETKGIPFSDYSPSELPSGLLSFCRDFFQVRIPELTVVNDLDFDHCYRFAHLYRNLNWTKIAPQEKEEIFHYFPNVQWAISQSRNRQIIFAAKGGSNNESHNHIDLGHFIFGSQYEFYLSDLGAGEYTKDYFDDEKRYEYLVNNALGHSIPIINSYYQAAGSVEVFCTSFYHKNEKAIFYTELASAYPNSTKLHTFNRQIELDMPRKIAYLKDHFIFNEDNNKVIENFITSFPVEIKDKRVKIKGKQICEMTFFNAEELIVKKEYYLNHVGVKCEANIIQAVYDIKREKTINIPIQILNS